MRHPALPTFAPLAAITLLLAPLASQSVSFGPGELTRIRLSAAVPAADLTQAVTGHFTGMHVRDAVVLAGSTPVLVTAPGVLRSAVTLPDRSDKSLTSVGFDRTQVRAIATVPDFPEEGRDALAVVTNFQDTQHGLLAGLWLWYQTGDGIYQMLHVSSSTAWSNMTKLRVANVGTASAPQLGILGLQQNGATIRCIEVKEPDQPADWPQWTLPTNGRVHDFQVADVMPGGLPEVVVLNAATTGAYAFSGGLRLFAPGQAAPLDTEGFQVSDGVLAAVSDSTGTRVFAAMRNNGADKLKLFVGGPAGLTAGPEVGLAGEPSAMAVAPWRDLGQLDALITLRNQPDPVVVACTGQQFGAVSVVPVTNAVAPVDYDNLATPLIADFHGDPAAPPSRQGRPRILYPVENLGLGQPAGIAMQNEVGWEEDGEWIWPAGHVRFGETAASQSEIRGVPVPAPGQPAEPQPTRIHMLSWAFDPAPAAPADRKARTESLGATTSALQEMIQGTQSYWVASVITAESATYGWQMMVRFECDGPNGTVLRWPARAAMIVDGTLAQSNNLQRLTEALAAVYGPAATFENYPVFVAFPEGGAFWGIIGDVVQPPGCGDTDDSEDEPPQGPGG
jgi:hypothetical protein